MFRKSMILMGGLVIAALSALGSNVYAWDHPGHMTVAAIAYADIARTQKMFIEASRWPDDARTTIHDRSSWHTARWPIIADDATAKSKAVAALKGDRPSGQAIEALELNFAMFSDPDAKVFNRAVSLCWLLHLVGDTLQPMHVADLYSKEFPLGNYAGSLNYVADPLRDDGFTMPLHMLWDSNTLRSTEVHDVIESAHEYMEKYPRSALPELTAHDRPIAFEQWARESHKIAADFAYGYGIETATDPNKDMDPVRLIE